MPEQRIRATVVIRHTCDGTLLCPDREDVRNVYRTKRGRYYVKVLNYEQPVVPLENGRFLLHFAGKRRKDKCDG